MQNHNHCHLTTTPSTQRLLRDLHQVEKDIQTVTHARMVAPNLASLLCLEQLFQRRAQAVIDVESQPRGA